MNDPKIITARKMLCEYLRNQAKEKGLSTYEIARKTGFKQQNVHRMLSGEHTPTLDNFMTLAMAIDCYFFIIDKDEDSDLAKMMKDRWQRKSQEN